LRIAQSRRNSVSDFENVGDRNRDDAGVWGRGPQRASRAALGVIAAKKQPLEVAVGVDGEVGRTGIADRTRCSSSRRPRHAIGFVVVDELRPARVRRHNVGISKCGPADVVDQADGPGRDLGLCPKHNVEQRVLSLGRDPIGNIVDAFEKPILVEMFDSELASQRQLRERLNHQLTPEERDRRPSNRGGPKNLKENSNRHHSDPRIKGYVHHSLPFIVSLNTCS